MNKQMSIKILSFWLALCFAPGERKAFRITFYCLRSESIKESTCIKGISCHSITINPVLIESRHHVNLEREQRDNRWMIRPVRFAKSDD